MLWIRNTAEIGGASERCKNLTIPLFCPNGTALLLAFRLASSGPKQPVVEDQQTDILPGFLRQVRVEKKTIFSLLTKRTFTNISF
jgi:hypothetical protein